MAESAGAATDLEERKIRIEEEKLALEQSFAKKWGSNMAPPQRNSHQH